MQAKSIETRYNSRRFRSRTEAKWAVFFDEMGIEYQYEPEGYTGNGLNYLPDFYLPMQNCFIEVKPDIPSEEELEKASVAINATNKDLFFLCGTPTKYRSFGVFPQIGVSDEREWAHCPKCDTKGLVYFGATEKLNCCPNNPGHSLANVYHEIIEKSAFEADNYKFGKIA